MNETIQVLMSHKSIRKFKDQEVPRDVADAIIQCAQWAATSNHFQAYTIIEIQDAKKRAALNEIAGNQDPMAECKLMLMFCADLHRGATYYDVADKDLFSNTENFIVSTIDATLAAEKAYIAAQSLGLGGVFVGGVRNDLAKVRELMEMPLLVYPIFILCLGYPDEAPSQKPRLPKEVVHKFDSYDTSKDDMLLAAYNKTISVYYKERTAGESDDTWAMRCAASVNRSSKRAKVGMELKLAGFLK